MRVVTKERNNPLNNSKTMCIFEFSDEDDVKTFNFMIKNAIRKLGQEDAKTLEELRTKLKERTSDKYAREGVWRSTFLFDTEANVFTLLLLSSNSLFSSKNDEKESFFL